MRTSLDRSWRTIVCAAPGPSLNAEQCAIAAQAQHEGRCRILVCNGAWEWIPSADVLYAADDRWWAVHRQRVIESGFAGELWTHDDITAARHELQFAASVFGSGLPRDPLRISRGGPSGHHLIQLAARFGGRQVLLIGYDTQRTAGRLHCHADHEEPLTNGDPDEWLPHFPPLAADLAVLDVDVVNCSIETALTCFRRSRIERELDYAQPAQFVKLTLHA